MPVTDLSGDDQDWLQQFLAGHQAGQAYGAGQPYGPGGAPGPYSGGPQGLMPGGGVMNRQGMTPGAPSIGYPAMTGPQGMAQAQQPPAATPGPAQGLSLTNNPITNAATGAYSNLHDWLTMHAGIPSWLQGGGAQAASSPAATTTAPPAGRRTDAAYGAYDDPNAPAAVGDYASRVGNYGSWPTTARSGAGASPAMGGAPMPPRRPANLGQAPGQGTPSGSPSQTPRPAKSGSRFGTVQYEVPGSGVGPLSRNPIYTSLNLFG
jgi:hypothetical protein